MSLSHTLDRLLPLSLRIGLRYTFTKRQAQSNQPLVSFLSSISIAGLVVGVGLLITVLSVMNGFDRELRENILSLVPQAVITHHEGIEDWPKLAEQLTTDEEVNAVAPFVRVYGLVVVGRSTEPAMIYGIEPSYETAVSSIKKYVSIDVLNELSSEQPYILLGKDLAEKMGAKKGGRVMVVAAGEKGGRRAARNAYFTVLDIIHSSTELDSSLALTSIAHAQKLTSSKNRVTGLRLSLQDIFSAPYVVYRNLRELGPGYTGNNWTRTHGNLHHAIKMSKNMVGLLMSLIVAIAAFNVVSTLILVVIDKEGDIAILRTLGLSTKQMMAVFIVQGSVIGTLGTSLGVLTGCILSLAVEDLVRFIEAIFSVQFLKSDVYPLTYMPSEILLSDIANVAGTALILCFLATLFPAWKASRVQPAEALRYE